MSEREQQIDKVIDGLRVIMYSNPAYSLMDILLQMAIKQDVPNLHLLRDDHIEDSINEIFPQIKDEDIEYKE